MKSNDSESGDISPLGVLLLLLFLAGSFVLSAAIVWPAHWVTEKFQLHPKTFWFFVAWAVLGFLIFLLAPTFGNVARLKAWFPRTYGVFSRCTRFISRF